jgi:hypothetical protein
MMNGTMHRRLTELLFKSVVGYINKPKIMLFCIMLFQTTFRVLIENRWNDMQQTDQRVLKSKWAAELVMQPENSTFFITTYSKFQMLWKPQWTPETGQPVVRLEDKVFQTFQFQLILWKLRINKEGTVLHYKWVITLKWRANLFTTLQIL